MQDRGEQIWALWGGKVDFVESHRVVSQAAGLMRSCFLAADPSGTQLDI